MRRALRIALVMAATATAAGCSSMENDNRYKSLIPARTLNISPSLTISAEALAAAGVIFLIVDPLAPNWKVEVAPAGQRRFSIRMTMKRFITGGEGEIGPVLRRAAEKLRDEGGYAEYALIELTEGIESRVPIAQRVAHGVIELR
jgi:hypothetical protein